MNQTDVKSRPAGIGQYLLGLVQVILNPRQGWLDAEKDNYSAKELIVKGVLPFLIIVALSPLVSAYFKLSMSYHDAIIEGVIQFSGYFVSIYLCNFVFSWALGRWIQPRRQDPNAVMTYVLYTVSAMAFITLLTNILPVDLSLWSFLPLYVVYIIWRGEQYMRIPYDRKPQFLACGVLCIFVPPYVLTYCLSLIV